MDYDTKLKCAIFYFRLRDGTILPLKYELQPNSLREKWIQAVRMKEKDENSFLYASFSNKNENDLEYLKDLGNSIINDINTFDEVKELYGDGRLPLLQGNADKAIDQKLMNELHEKFEEYGEYVSKNEVSQENNDRWMDLNEWIHITEMAISISPTGFPPYSCLCSIHPAYIGEPLDELDKLFLDNEFPWGGLYLGYNTLGKDYAHAMYDNDTRLILNDQVKVQTHYSTEVWLNFSETTWMYRDMERTFYHWYESLSQDVQEKIPIHDRNKLALGRYHLGRIIIDETFLNFHNDIDAWRTDPELQCRWNNEVFSKVEEFIGIEILE